MKNRSFTRGASLWLPVQIPYRLRLLAAAITAALALGACSGNGAASSTTVPSSIPVDTISPSHDDEEIPSKYLEAVLDDVATRTGLTEADLTVLVATAIEWANQRLGCVHFEDPAEPMAVDGYRVVVHTGEAEYDYRLDADGFSQLCGEPVASPPDEGEHQEDDENPDESTS